MTKDHGTPALARYALYLLSLGLLVAGGCRATPPAVLQSPLSPLSPLQSAPEDPLARRVDVALRGRIGEEYFDAHYRRQAVEQVDGAIKATYLYTYPPHVTDRTMTLFLDPETLNVAETGSSDFLLTPQAFNLDVEAAIERAEAAGAEAAGAEAAGIESESAPRVELVLGEGTGGRFAWQVTGPAAEDAEAPPGTLLILAIDVETGEIHYRDVVGRDTGH